MLRFPTVALLLVRLLIVIFRMHQTAWYNRLDRWMNEADRESCVFCTLVTAAVMPSHDKTVHVTYIGQIRLLIIVIGGIVI